MEDWDNYITKTLDPFQAPYELIRWYSEPKYDKKDTGTYPCFTAFTDKHVYIHQNGETDKLVIEKGAFLKRKTLQGKRQVFICIPTPNLEEKNKIIELKGVGDTGVSIMVIRSILHKYNKEIQPFARNSLSTNMGKKSPQGINIWKEMCSKYNLKRIDAITKAHVLTGKYNDFWIEARWDNAAQINAVSIEVTCPNPWESYFSISLETLSSNLKKLINIKDVEVNNQEFDAQFLLQTNHVHLLQSILTAPVRVSMKSAVKFGDCTWSFGSKTKSTNPLDTTTPSNFSDKEDVLDFQMLKPSETIQSQNVASLWDSNNTSKIKFEAAINYFRMDYPSSGKLIRDGFTSAVSLAENIVRYLDED